MTRPLAGRAVPILIAFAILPSMARGIERQESFNLTTADGRLLVLSHGWEDSCEIRGTVVHSTGEWGTDFYGAGPVQAATLAWGIDNCLDVWVVTWFDNPAIGSRGWMRPGQGFRDALRAIADEVVPFVRSRMAGPVLCWQGNSGGSMQGAYGLQWGAAIDVAILSGGPPTSDLRQLCAVDGPGGGALVDFAEGWPPGTCFGQVFTPEQEAQIDYDQLLLGAPTFLPAKVWILEGLVERDRPQGRLFRDELVAGGTTVAYEEIVPVHEVDEDPVGADRIREILAAQCRILPDCEELVLSDDTIVSFAVYQACRIVAGPNLGVVGPNGDLTLIGWSVRLDNGFSVGVDGRLAVSSTP